MDQMEISLLILRHLAREGCKDAVRAYMNECPAVKPVVGVQTDFELFRQKLLNRSLSLSLVELLSEYSRAKSTIQELTSKLLYEWNALSTLYLSPHDSMATQLAHIAQLLETKCKRVPMDSKLVGTSDDPEIVPPVFQERAKEPVQCAKFTVDAEVQTDAVVEHVQTAAVDAEVQTGTVAAEGKTDTADEPEGEEPEEELPDIVESLLEPQNLDKMVEIANKELNRSSQSTHENVLNNDTEVEIDKMLLDILHGIGPGSSIPNSALNEGCSSNQVHQSETPVGVADSQVQLMELFQDAQSVIVNTPIAGTLGHPEDSASKQPKQYTSFLDLIDTPFKNAFVSNPSTPIAKPITSTSSLLLEAPAEKIGLKTVALDFGPVTGNLTSSVSSIGPVSAQITLTKARSSGPRYSIVQQCKAGRDDLERLRKRRDITPRIPTSITSQVSIAASSAVTQSSDRASSSSSVLLRSASKRKFTTPVKISPAKALLSTVHFYCPSSSLQERHLSTPISANKQSDSMDTPHKSLTVTPKEKSTDGTGATVVSNSPLVTINYDDLLGGNTASIHKKTAAVAEPSVQQQPLTEPSKPVDAPAAPPAQDCPEVSVSVASMTTPDSRLDEQRRPEECLESSRTPHMYNRLLASVRHSRPITVVNKKSYSTPRKKGHIRNLMFKTPPGAQHDKMNKLLNVEQEPPVKRKRSPTPPPGSKSRKRLKWNTLIKSANESEERVEPVPTPLIILQVAPVATTPQVQVPGPSGSSAPLPTPSVLKEGPKQPKPVPTSRSKVSMAEVASKVVSKVSVSTRSRGSTVKPQSQKALKKITQQEVDDSPKLANASEKRSDPLPSTSAPNRRRRSKRMEEQLAAEAAAVSAIPLGNRGNNHNDQRVTRKTRSAAKSSPEEPRNQYWLPSTEVQMNAEPIRQPPSFADSSCSPSPPKVSQSDGLAVPVTGASISSAPSGWPKIQQHVNISDVSVAESQPNGETSHVSIIQNKELGAEVSHPRTRQRRSKISSVAAPNLSRNLEIIPPVSATPSPRLEAVSVSTSSTRLTSLQLAKAFPNLSSSLEKSHELNLTDKGKSTTDSSASTSTASTPSTSTRSPSRGRPKSPRKTPQKGTPRRILPKPVPPDHPLPPVFPPPLPSPGYVLSIPSNTPTKDGDVFSSISVVTSSPIPPPSIVITAPSSSGKGPALSSSDSSSEISVTSSSPVPMTPRLRPDPGEESSMHTRMFPDTSCGPGVPIFSSTPLKFGPPETPGKNILNTLNPAVTNVMNESGECSRGSSLFDTPVKIGTPPVVATVPPVMATPTKSASNKTPPRATSSSRQTRKSPRKVKTPTKQPQPKTPPRKAKTPVKSAQKAGPPQSFEYKPTKRTPYRSPLSKKNAPTEGDRMKQETPSTKVSSKAQQAKAPTSKISPKISEGESSRISLTTEPNPNSSFPSVCTKSRSFLRLAEIARRGRANSTVEAASTTAASVTSVVDQLPATKAIQQPPTVVCKRDDTTVTKENNEKAKNAPEAHFQFAVSGRAKQLSLSEHETLIGLLQMGSVKTQLDKPQTVQRPESNLLSGIDVFQFLKKVHQAE